MRQEYTRNNRYNRRQSTRQPPQVIHFIQEQPTKKMWEKTSYKLLGWMVFIAFLLVFFATDVFLPLRRTIADYGMTIFFIGGLLVAGSAIMSWKYLIMLSCKIMAFGLLLAILGYSVNTPAARIESRIGPEQRQQADDQNLDGTTGMGRFVPFHHDRWPSHRPRTTTR